jgi:hypothetical protein
VDDDDDIEIKKKKDDDDFNSISEGDLTKKSLNTWPSRLKGRKMMKFLTPFVKGI